MSKLLLGDSAKVLKQIQDNSIDLTVTSPPYDELREYKGFVFDFKTIANELYRVTKDGGVVVWIVADATVNGSETGTSFRQALYFKDIGFNIHDTMIWSKKSIVYPNPSRYGQSFEYMFVLSKGKPFTINKIKDRKNLHGGTAITGTERQKNGSLRKMNGAKTGKVINEYGERFNVWDMPCGSHNTTGHPAVFPIQLAKDHILSWSNKGDVVLDPFMGSGTTGLACYDTQRQFIGIEISEEYFTIAKYRINEAESQIMMDI